MADLIPLKIEKGLWKHFFTVSPLIIVGTKEDDSYNLAPKHMATPLGQGPYFAFVCTPRHNTYHNIREHKVFSVSFPRPEQIVESSLLAEPRSDSTEPKWTVDSLATSSATTIDTLVLKDAYLILECELDRIVDGFDNYSLIIGKISAASVDGGFLRSKDKDDQDLIFRHPLMAYLAYGRFAEIKDSVAFPFPKNFNELPK